MVLLSRPYKQRREKGPSFVNTCLLLLPERGAEGNAQPLLCRNEENRVGKRLDPKGIFISPPRGKPLVCALSVSCGSDEGILSREQSDQDLDAAFAVVLPGAAGSSPTRKSQRATNLSFVT